MLNGDNVKPQIMSMIDQAIEANVKALTPENTLHDDWDLRGLRDHYLGWMVNPDELHYEGQAFEDLEQQTVIDFLKERAQCFTTCVRRRSPRRSCVKWSAWCC